MTTGIQAASGIAIDNPLPVSWLGRPDAPTIPSDWSNVNQLSATEVRNLQAQIAYDLSGWDYSLVGTDNRLGRYQFSTKTLERYGLLAAGSNDQYGTACINYQSCWQQTTQRKNTTSLSNYLHNVTNLSEFISSTISQEQLADQIIHDLYNNLLAVDAILLEDTADIVAGMIYVGWILGPGTKPKYTLSNGSGAYAWRYYNVGNGAQAFNSGRYAVTILSQ